MWVPTHVHLPIQHNFNRSTLRTKGTNSANKYLSASDLWKYSTIVLQSLLTSLHALADFNGSRRKIFWRMWKNPWENQTTILSSQLSSSFIILLFFKIQSSVKSDKLLLITLLTVIYFKIAHFLRHPISRLRQVQNYLL